MHCLLKRLSSKHTACRRASLLLCCQLYPTPLPRSLRTPLFSISHGWRCRFACSSGTDVRWQMSACVATLRTRTKSKVESRNRPNNLATLGTMMYRQATASEERMLDLCSEYPNTGQCYSKTTDYQRFTHFSCCFARCRSRHQ